jgi:hypothetical protein
LLEASRLHSVDRFLFSSSACVYAQSKQKDAQVTPLEKRTRFPLTRNQAVDGRNSMSSSCASTIGRTTASTRALRASFMCTLGTYEGGGERPPPRSATR